MNRVMVTIRFPNGYKEDLEIPSTVKVKKWEKQVVEYYSQRGNVSALNEEGEWSVFFEEREIMPDETLEEAGIETGSIIFLKRRPK